MEVYHGMALDYRYRSFGNHCGQTITMARCEDFPCCGHQLGECPTGPAKNCPDCGRLFEPCSLGDVYCLACGSRPPAPKLKMENKGTQGTCTECGCQTTGGYDTLRKVTWGRDIHDNICEGCEDAYGQACAEDADDRAHGRFDYEEAYS